MTLDKFTIKAQEAVQEAVNTAQRNGQQTIEPTHLLAGVMAKAKDVTNFLFQKLGVNGQQIEMLIQQELQHLPRVQGGEPYLSSDANKVLLKSQDYAHQMGDEFVSCEMQALLRRNCVQPYRNCARDRRCSRRVVTRTIRVWRNMPRIWWNWPDRESSTQ